MTKNTKLSGTCRKTRCSSKCIYYAYMLLFYSYQLFMCEIVWNCCMHNKCMGLYRNLITRLQSNPNNSNLQRKEKKVRFIRSSSYQGYLKLYRKWSEGKWKLLRVSRRYELQRVQVPGSQLYLRGKMTS